MRSSGNMVPEPPLEAPLSAGEMHHFYWFIQGSIMVPDTRASLHRSWGFCERHAWGHLAVETAFLLGPAILYEDLVGRTLQALRRPAIGRDWRRRLRPKGPFMMCEMDAFRAGSGAASPTLIERGKRIDRLRTFALGCCRHWEETVCGSCANGHSQTICRRHLMRGAPRGSWIALPELRPRLEDLHDQLAVYGNSFTWELRGTSGPEHRAALITAIGWMSGWRPLLHYLQPSNR